MSAPVPRVAVYGRDDPRLPGTLRGKLEQRQAQLAAQLVTGGAEDWPDYKERVGMIRGIETAINICAEAERDQER